MMNDLNKDQKTLTREQEQVLNLLDYFLSEFILDGTMQEKLEVTCLALIEVDKICTTEKSIDRAEKMIMDVIF